MSREEQLVERVRKLLAKAESTANANEAEAFSAKAAALIAEHRLDPTRVKESLRSGQLVVRRVEIGRGAYVRARLSLLHAVAAHHDCELVWHNEAVGAVAIVAGFDDDVSLTEVLYHSLHTQAASQMAAIRQTRPGATQRFRRSFLFGYARRIDELLTESKAASTASASAAAAATTSGETLPDVAARTDRVKTFAAAQFGRVVRASAPKPAQASAWAAGHRAAGSADLGRTRLAGRPALRRAR